MRQAMLLLPGQVFRYALAMLKVEYSAGWKQNVANALGGSDPGAV